MKVTLRYTSQLAAAVGRSEESLELPDGTFLIDLLENLADAHGPEFAKFVMSAEGVPVRTLVVAVNGSQVDLKEKIALEAGSEVILITPMSGG